MAFQKTGKAEQIGEALCFDGERLAQLRDTIASRPLIAAGPACKRTGLHMVLVGEKKCALCGEEPE